MQNYPPCSVLLGQETHENLSSPFANIKGTDQPVHPHSLVSDFVVRLLESIISITATSELSISSWSELEDTFSHGEAHLRATID